MNDTPRDYTDNERRLLTIAAQNAILLQTTAEAASETIRELTAEIEARDKRLREIDAITDEYLRYIGKHDLRSAMQYIALIARDDPGEQP